MSTQRETPPQHLFDVVLSAVGIHIGILALNPDSRGDLFKFHEGHENEIPTYIVLCENLILEIALKTDAEQHWNLDFGSLA